MQNNAPMAVKDADSRNTDQSDDDDDDGDSEYQIV